MDIDIKTCGERLLAHDNILIICHRDPDGDTVGSAMALLDSLTAMGKKVKMECVSKVPRNLQFILREFPQFKEEYVVAVDVASPKMLGDGDIRERHIDLCIDHHPSNNFFAEETCLKTYPAAGELVYDILCSIGAPISPFGATCLLTAISSDTGSFKYSGTTAKTMRCGANLLDLNADKNLVRVNIFESNKKSRIAVESLALSQIEFFENEKIAVVSITLDMMKKCGADETELEGIAAVPMTIEGVSVGITIKERDDGYIRVSVRCDENVDASEICKAFEGGGHVRASGCRIKATLQEAKEKLLKEAKKQL